MGTDTIAAIATAMTSSGIGIVRISGDEAVSITDRIFEMKNQKKLEDMPTHTIHYGHIHDGDEVIDEVMVVLMRGPKSYTREDTVEIDCHGGVYVMKRILETVIKYGARPAEPGEFTKRAFLNGKIDLSEAEAVIDIISAKSRSAARAALCVKEGALRKKIDGVKNDLLSMAAHLSAWADYPEEDIAEVTADSVIETCDKAIKCFKSLLDSYDCGQAVKKGIDTVIAGRPNVGKSTLMNLLSGYEKRIVTDIHGTTRDIVEDTVTVGDVVLNLSDTAGLRDTEDTVEKIGVDRARKRLEQCGLLLAVFDNSRELDEDDYALIESAKLVPSIAVINKTDLDNKLDIEYISAISGDGRDELTKAVEKIAGTQNFNPSEGVLSNERQRIAVKNALDSVIEAMNALKCGMTFDAVTVSIEDAISHLLELTGERTSDEVVDRVFHNFCVGK